MYEFKSMGVDHTHNEYRPGDDMIINGKSLSDIVGGYQQLNVDGRQFVSQRLMTEEIPARDGLWLNDLTQAEREIRVMFKLETKSHEELRSVFTHLNKYLRTDDEPLEIRFRDEMDWAYYGYFETAEVPPETSLNLVGTLVFKLLDPYKYRDQAVATNGRIRLLDGGRVLPTKIVATVTNTANELEIINGNRKIRFVDMSFKAGESIVIDYLPNSVEVTYQGRSILHYIALQYFPETFYLEDGDIVAGKNARIDRVEWRERRL